MGTLLDKPMTEKETATEKGTDGLEFGVSAMQGWRVDMEDAHTIIANVPELEGHSFVAVFDGHGGAACAHYAGKNMMRHIAETAEFKEYVGSDTKDTKILEKALYVGFLACDRSVKAEQDESTDGDRSGSTAVAAFVTPKHVVVAHAGDSRAVLASGQEVAFATADHKPYNEGERHRIEKAGGVVSMKRVDGDLAVSRALGDFQYKDEGLAPEDCKVSPAPETKSIERKPEDEFLVVACDGIWDVLSDEDCTQAIREIFVEGESDLGLACEELLDMCLFQGSRDNMSAVLVAFPGLKRESTGEGVKGRRAQREAEDSEADSQNDDDGETAAAAAAAPAPAGGTAPPAAATQGEQATAEATAESK